MRHVSCRERSSTEKSVSHVKSIRSRSRSETQSRFFFTADTLPLAKMATYRIGGYVIYEHTGQVRQFDPLRTYKSPTSTKQRALRYALPAFPRGDRGGSGLRHGTAGTPAPLRCAFGPPTRGVANSSRNYGQRTDNTANDPTAEMSTAAPPSIVFCEVKILLGFTCAPS
jgi:hypothetical protein